MKPILLLFIVFIPFNSYAQFAIVDDNDGFVNIRTSAENINNITDTLHNGHLVWCFEPEGNWVSIDYAKKGRTKTGFIYKDRIRFLKAFESLVIAKLDKQQVTLLKDSIKVIISIADFIPRNNSLQNKTNNNFRYISSINGKKVWGTDGNVPKKQYQSIEVQMGRRRINISATAMENLFEPNLHNAESFYHRQNDTLYITAMNSDGAGGYVVVWTIEKGKYKGRFITNGF